MMQILYKENILIASFTSLRYVFMMTRTSYKLAKSIVQAHLYQVLLDVLPEGPNNIFGYEQLFV